jgi:hypothetical protein
LFRSLESRSLTDKAAPILEGEDAQDYGGDKIDREQKCAIQGLPQEIAAKCVSPATAQLGASSSVIGACSNQQ